MTGVRPTALVVGAGGLVGSAVARAIAATGSDVTATVRSESNRAWFAEALAGATVDVLPSILDAVALTALIERVRPQVVVSCVGVTSAVGTGAARILVDGNVATAGVVLEACQQSDVRRALIFGSGFEYIMSAAPLSEADPIGPTTLYGATKVAASDLAAWFRGHAGLDVCVVRPFSVYGPRERLHRFVPAIVTAALQDRPIEMSSGTQRRDYLFVDDLAAGIARAATHPDPLPPALNFAGAEEQTLLEMATAVVELSGSSSAVRAGVRPPNPEDRAVFLGDSGLARELLDWQPAFDLRTGLAATIAWYRSNRLLWESA